MSAPGWFPDPSDPSRQRYFDGTTWTEEYAQLGAPPPPIGKPPMSRGRKIGLLGAGAAALLAVTLASIFSSEIKDLYAEVSGGAAEAIAGKCGNGTFKLMDDKNSISLSLKESSSEEQFDFLWCILDEAGAPASIRFRMGNTRPMDGTQEADWDGWELFWSYEGKDEGMDVLLSKV